MAFTNTVRIDVLEERTASNGNPYQYIKWTDTSNGKQFTKTNYAQGLFEVFKIAYESKDSGATVVVTIDQNKIIDAVLGGISETPPEKQQEAIDEGVEKLADKQGGPYKDISPQERGMWLKEIGEWMREGKLEELFPNNHKALEILYRISMCEGLGIEIKKK